MINATEQYQAAITARARRIYIKAAVDISDPDLMIGAVTATPQAPWSRPEQLTDKEKDAPPRYVTLERNRWLLNGGFPLIPADPQAMTGQIGEVSAAVSGDDGTFAEPQIVQQAFSKVDILQAFSLFFSTDEIDGVPSDFTAEVLYNNVAYYTKEVTGNRETAVSFDGFTVYTPTSIRLTVTKWSLPGRRARVIEILPGVYEEWTESMLASFEATHQAAFSCLTLPYGTVTLAMNNKSRRFEPRSKNGLFQSIEERQGVQCFIGVGLADGSVDYKPLGMFYQAGDGWKTGDNSLSMSWSLVDIVGLVCDRTFIVPDVLPTTLSGWIAAVVAQLGKNFEKNYHVDPDYSDLPVVAVDAKAVTGKKCGDIIRWACMVTGTWPRADAETGYLTAEPLWSQGNKVQLRNLVNYPTMRANESIAALIYHLSDGTEFVVSGNSTSAEKTVTIENPFIHTTEQAIAASRQILSCYGGNMIETTGRGDPSSEIGDVDTIWLDESQATTARRMMQTFSMADGVLQGCQSKLLQADGSYLFENNATITESGTWKAPAGVSVLRVTIGQGGQGGMRGQDGAVERGTIPTINGDTGEILSRGSTISRPGVEGSPGIGGKIWFGVININPEQEFAIHIGQGGAPSTEYGVEGALGEETTFGAYSSENGKVYPLGFTSIADGESYGRTGVPSPANGTSDGSKGGTGGAGGAGEWEKASLTIESTGRHIYYMWWKQTKPPEPGKIPPKGADGFVSIWWDKPEETA